MRFGLRGLLVIVALCSAGYTAYDARQREIPRRCRMNQRGIETAFAIYQTSNFCWARRDPYLVELSTDGVMDYRSFDGRKREPLTSPEKIRNVVRDDRMFRCPAMDTRRRGPAYRCGVKNNRNDAEFIRVECLVDPSHNDPAQRRFFLEPRWLSDEDQAAPHHYK
jgi:hypothetical protein